MRKLIEPRADSMSAHIEPCDRYLQEEPTSKTPAKRFDALFQRREAPKNFFHSIVKTGPGEVWGAVFEARAADRHVLLMRTSSPGRAKKAIGALFGQTKSLGCFPALRAAANGHVFLEIEDRWPRQGKKGA